MRSENEIPGPGLDDKIANGDRGEIVWLELRPILAAVNADPEPEFGAGEKHGWVHAVLANDMGVAAQALGRSSFVKSTSEGRPSDPRPGLPIIRSTIHPWIHVAESVAVKSGVGDCRIEPAGFEAGNPGVWRKIRDVFDEVGPALAPIDRQLEVAIIGADPDQPAIFWGFANRIDAGMHLGGGVIHRDAARFLLLLLLGIIGGKVRRDAVPGIAAIF